MLEEALIYAAQGWPVFPLMPRSKAPATTHGFKEAATDEGQVRAWWGQNPAYNIGLRTGDTFFVVDVDVRDNGDKSLKLFPPLPVTLTANTGGGGQHYLFRMPTPDTHFRSKLWEGIDIKGVGGYIVAPPSVHPNGGVYEWVDYEAMIAPAPDWLLRVLTPPPMPTRVMGETDPNDDRPGSVYNRTMGWDELLEAAGWTLVYERDDVGYWRRPGKDDGVSASTNYGGSDLLWVWTTSTEFDSSVSYSKFGAYALLHHGGDLSAAGQALAAMYAPPTACSPPATEYVGPAVYAYSSPFPEDHFVSRYVHYASQQTSAPGEFHEAAALALLACVTPTLRARLAPYPGGLSTNLYLLLAGATTRSHKSTAQRIALDLLKAVLPTVLLGSRMTTEVLISELAGRPSLPSLWAPDEFGVQLAQVYRRDHLQGIEELLLTIYGGEDYSYTTVSRGTEHVRQPHLTLLAAATPESVGFAGPQALLGGLLPRFGIVMPSSLPPERPVGELPDLHGERAWLVQRLAEVLQWQGQFSEMAFSKEALAVLNAGETALVDQGTLTARLPTMLYKVAVLSAAGTRSNVVQTSDAAGAVQVGLRWLKGAGNLVPYLKRKSVDAEFAALCQEVLDIVDDAGGSCHRQTVAGKMQLKKSTLDGLIGTLTDWGSVVFDMNSGVLARSY